MFVLWHDQLVREEEVSISYKDRGYYFGDGVYEVFRFYAGRLYEQQSHLNRLVRSASQIRLQLPYSIQHIEHNIEKLLVQEEIIEGTLYLQITRGAASRSHTFPEQAEPVLMAYCSEVKRPLVMIREGISTITLPDIRWHRCDIKSLNLLPNIMAKQQAEEQSAGEVILHRDGIVTECSASNVMIVKEGALYTHPANHLILHGITRMVTLRLAAQLGLGCHEEAFSVDMLLLADEVFITGTTMEITPVIQVDQTVIGDGAPGPVTRSLQAAFEETIG